MALGDGMMIDHAVLEALSGLLLISGMGVLSLAAIGVARADGVEYRLRIASAATPGLWSVGLAIVLHALS